MKLSKGGKRKIADNRVKQSDAEKKGKKEGGHDCRKLKGGFF
jgi:hypothetical protein